MKQLWTFVRIYRPCTPPDSVVLLGPIMLQVKSESELRHVIAHLYGAIEALTNGHTRAAIDELASVHGLVFFESDAEAEAYYQSQEGNHGRTMPKATEAYQKAGR